MVRVYTPKLSVGWIVGFDFDKQTAKIQHSDDPEKISNGRTAVSLIAELYEKATGEPVGIAMEKKGLNPDLRNLQGFLKSEPGLEERMVKWLKENDVKFSFFQGKDPLREPPNPADTVLPIFEPFFYSLMEEDYNLEVSLHQVLDFYKGLGTGLIRDMESLFVFSRGVLVKKLSQMDSFERAFAKYFFGVDIPNAAVGDINTLYTKSYREWLNRLRQSGVLDFETWIDIPSNELVRMFWKRVMEQLEEHHGGSYWIGTMGDSPFGHSGSSRRGIRVYGQSAHRSALQVIGEKRYIHYSDEETLSGENIRQALEALKHLTPEGPLTYLDIEKTIERTAKTGDIEFVFGRKLIDKLKVILMLDNGGDSMQPYVELTQLLFRKMHNQFRRITPYYFHNCIYDYVFIDPQRAKPHPLERLLEEDRETRVFIVGDASMAHEELYNIHGAISGRNNREPGLAYLKKMAEHFRYSVWLNPIKKERWEIAMGEMSIKGIAEIFYMEDMTLGGIKRAVEHLVLLAK